MNTVNMIAKILNKNVKDAMHNEHNKVTNNEQNGTNV